MLERNIDIFGEHAFDTFKNAGLEFRIDNDKTKIFRITDVGKLAGYQDGRLINLLKLDTHFFQSGCVKDLEFVTDKEVNTKIKKEMIANLVYSNADVLDENLLKEDFLGSFELQADNFLENSIRDIKIFFNNNGGHSIEYAKICRDLVENNSDAFADGAFANVNLDDENTCKFLGLKKGNNMQAVKWYKFWAYFLKFFLGIGYFSGLTEKYLNAAAENKKYNAYLNKIKLLINKACKLVEPIKSLDLEYIVLDKTNNNKQSPSVSSDESTIDPPVLR